MSDRSSSLSRDQANISGKKNQKTQFILLMLTWFHPSPEDISPPLGPSLAREHTCLIAPERLTRLIASIKADTSSFFKIQSRFLLIS